jgi:hypothetical protein
MIFIWLVKEMILLISEKQYDRNWPECHQLIMQGAGRKPPDFFTPARRQTDLPGAPLKRSGIPGRENS